MPSVAAAVSCKGASSGTLRCWLDCELFGQVAFITPDESSAPAGASAIVVAEVTESPAAVLRLLEWFHETDADYLLWAFSSDVDINVQGMKRFLDTAKATEATITYSDYFDQEPGQVAKLHPLIDYQSGSLRDDFDFGRVVLLDGRRLRELFPILQQEDTTAKYGGWYQLRLRLNELGPVVHLTEPTYTVPVVEKSEEGDGHFSYVDPRNRDYQIEMEQIATSHLGRIGAYIDPPRQPLAAEQNEYPVEASVVIPVRNRDRTVRDAVESALSQETDFPFNVVVVDNHSTDDTSAILKEIAAADSRLVHLVPGRNDLGIGGCWNEALYSDVCGRYVVQLDSDDLYSSTDVLRRIIAEFRSSQCAMVVGSYEIVNFELEQIPPGLIDHREWTDENGHNNALRIAGLGAPRAFHTATLRQTGFPNVSYGEDYAVALRIAGRHRIGRIYDSLYLCRRWEDNTDHTLPLETVNRYAAYKDRIRTIEIEARKNQNR